MSGDSLNACEQQAASGVQLPGQPNPDEESLDADRIERIRLIFRNIDFFPPTGGRTAMWPSVAKVLGVDAEGLRLDPAKLGGALSALPSLPMAVMESLRAADGDDMPIEVLAGKIEVDQGLVARLLRVANSAFYGLQRKVSSVHDAIVVLGTGNVHNLVLAVSLSDYAQVATPVGEMHLPSFLRHSIAVATCARALAPRIGCDGNTAFAAGLLHDVGRLVLAKHYPRHMAEVRRYQQHLDCLLWEAERQVLGIDHAGIGVLIAERWNFPQGLCAAILGHHDPEFIERTPVACVVHIADAMVHALEMSGNERKHLPRIFAPCWQAASLSWTDCQEVFAEVELGLEAFTRTLGIALSPRTEAVKAFKQ